jgi:carboxylesterase type B
LSDEIVNYWVSFAKTGKPSGAVEWPALDLATRQNIVFANQTTVEDSTVLCTLWDAIGYNH